MNFEEWCKTNAILLFSLVITFFIQFLIVFGVLLVYIIKELKKKKKRAHNRAKKEKDASRSSPVSILGQSGNMESKLNELDNGHDHSQISHKEIQVISISDGEDENDVRLNNMGPKKKKFNSFKKFGDELFKKTPNKGRQSVLTPISIIATPILHDYSLRNNNYDDKIKTKKMELKIENKIQVNKEDKIGQNSSDRKKIVEKNIVNQIETISNEKEIKNLQLAREMRRQSSSIGSEVL